MTHHYVFSYYFPTSHNSLVLRDTQKQTLLRLVSVSFLFPLIIILWIMGEKNPTHSPRPWPEVGGSAEVGPSKYHLASHTKLLQHFSPTYCVWQWYPASLPTNLQQLSTGRQYLEKSGKSQISGTSLACSVFHTQTEQLTQTHEQLQRISGDSFLASYFQSLIAANNLSLHLPVSLSLTDISLASPQLPLLNDY